MNKITCNLTTTQALILTDLTHGVTIKQIAYARHIKRRTVSQHITDARARLNAETRDQMIAIFVATFGVSVNLAREKSYQTSRIAE